jgi:spermidine synthase
VTILQRFGQLNLMSNGVPIETVPTPDITFIEEFIHLPMLFHPHPQHVLLVSGGIGGVLQEILKHPVQQIDYAELDPLILHSIQQYAPLQTVSDLHDSRVHVHYVDGRYLMRTTEKKYDLIFINLPDPSTLEINRFYTREFYRMSKQRLQERGIFCFGLPGSTSYLSKELIDLNAHLIQTVNAIFPYIRIIPGEYTLLLASSYDGITTVTPDMLIQRMADRSLHTRLLSDFHIRYKFDARRLEWYHSQIGKAPEMSLNRDFSPLALYYDLVFWNSLHSPGFARIFTQLKRLQPSYIVIAMVFTFGLIGYLRHSRGIWKSSYLVLAIVATGFTGMGVDIVLVLAFQSFYGYIYHWIGLLITAFMIGLTGGGIWMMRKVKQGIKEEKGFLALELSLVLYTIVLLAVLFLLYQFQEYTVIFSATQFILLGLNMLCGWLVGAEFPLATAIYLKSTSHYTQTAGIIYAADLIGSWIGALLVTLALIPLFGIMKTCLLMLCINICSAYVFSRSTK